jgi:hypothetical protein
MLLRIFGVVIIILPFPPNWGGDERVDEPVSAPVEYAGAANESSGLPASVHVFSTSELGEIEILDHLKA